MKQEPNKVWPGMNCKVVKSPRGVIVSGEGAEIWRHPWWIDLEYAERAKPEPVEPEGEWRGTIWPGFVNGRDSFIAMPDDWPEEGDKAHYAALTDEPQPYLVLDGWRNPVMPAGANGGVLQPGEGYPAFFASIGVRLPAKGGDPFSASSFPPYDEDRTREIRAMDVVLKIPRFGTRLDYRAGDPLIESQSEFLQTIYLSEYFVSVGGRSILSATSKHRDPDPQTLEGLYGLLLRAGTDEYDVHRVATVWMVSPPKAGEDAVPDQTWEPYMQHFLFWNLSYAPTVIPKPSGSRLTFDVPLAGGVAQPLINSMLGRINDMNEEAEQFLIDAVPKGAAWTP